MRSRSHARFTRQRVETACNSADPTRTGLLFCMNDLQRPSCPSMVWRRSTIRQLSASSTMGPATLAGGCRLVQALTKTKLLLPEGCSGIRQRSANLCTPADSGSRV